MRRDRLTTGALAVTLFLAVLWGGNAVAVKVGLLDCPPLRLGWLRFVLGGIVVLAYAWARGESLSLVPGERALLLGLGCLFASQLALMNLGQDRTAASHAAIIMSAYPLWTSAFAHFFIPGDRLTPGRVVGALIAYAGVFVVFGASYGGNDEGALVGDGLLVGSSVLLGARQIVLSRGAQRIPIVKLLLAQAVVGTASFVIASALFETDATQVTPRLGLALGYQGFVIAGFAFLVQTWLLKNFPPSRVTMVYMAQPLFGVVLSHWILREPLGPTIFTGAGLVAVGCYLVQRREPKLESGVR